MAFIEAQRKRFLVDVCGTVVGTKPNGAPTMADADSPVSVQIASELLTELRKHKPASRVRLKPQAVGAQFDEHVREYLDRVFARGMPTLRCGKFDVRSGVHIRETAQYAHLEILRQIGEDPSVTVQAVARKQFRAVTAADYQVRADVVVLRRPESNPTTARGAALVSPTSGCAAATLLLRHSSSQKKILHANISCKWTFRSDRAQNIRTEAVALMRHRKGRMPHMVVVTAEPMPSRLRSVAIGTGEVDCVYHIALPELERALQRSHALAGSLRTARARSARQRALDDQLAVFELMRDGDRLRDISDLPFDLAI